MSEKQTNKALLKENTDGLFGTTTEEREQIHVDTPACGVEKQFLDNPNDCFAIYQHNSTAPAKMRFLSYDGLDDPPLWTHYDAVFTGALAPAATTGETLEGLFYQFNEDRPKHFTGHSLSVSDIVALKQNGVVSYYYCDTVGFREVPDFQKPENYLKAAEMTMEDDYGMIDGIINNGPKQKKPELEECRKKSSIMEQLRNPPPQKSKEKTAPMRSEEREL